MRIFGCALLAFAAFAWLQPIGIAKADASADSKSLVVIPYQEPADTAALGSQVTAMLLSDLTTARIKTVSVAPVDHVHAVANAAQICSENDAAGILIPEGRSDVTGRLSYFVVASTVTYEWHVDFRLDLVDCRGVVRRSVLASGNKSSTGVLSPVSPGGGNMTVGPLQSAFQSAVQSAVQQYAASPPDLAADVAPPAAGPVTSPSVTSKLLLIPVGQPGMADPNAAAVTDAALAQMKLRNVDVTLGSQIDHLTVFAAAAQLCASNGAQGIVVPRLEIVQVPFSGQARALLRLDLFACDGTPVAYGSGEGDLRKAPKHDFRAAVVDAARQALAPALDQLFPSTKSANGA